MRKDKMGILRDVICIGLLGLNSFLMLLYKNWLDKPIKYVICAGALGYVLGYQDSGANPPQSRLA